MKEGVAIRIADLEEANAKLKHKLINEQRRYSILRKAAETAASAPGRNWLQEQLDLGRVLISLDKE
jgi:hypothetical protein